MPAQADIIVSTQDSTEVTLVVEAKLIIFTSELSAMEHRLKNYMLQVRCPLGLVITPQHLWVYRDRFTSYSEESIERVGEFATEGLFDVPESSRRAAQQERTLVSDSGAAFENAVQGWLENLSRGNAPGKISDPKLREVVDHYIRPAVETGVIRAAGPR